MNKNIKKILNNSIEKINVKAKIIEFFYLLIMSGILFMIYKIENQKIIEDYNFNCINSNYTFKNAFMNDIKCISKEELKISKLLDSVSNKIDNEKKIKNLTIISVSIYSLFIYISVKNGLDSNILSIFSKFISLLIRIYNLYLYKFLLSKEEIEKFEEKKKYEKEKSKLDQNKKINKIFSIFNINKKVDNENDNENENNNVKDNDNNNDNLFKKLYIKYPLLKLITRIILAISLIYVLKGIIDNMNNRNIEVIHV